MKSFLSLSRGKQIAFVTLGIHFLFLFSLGIHHVASDAKRIKTKIAVRTVRPHIRQEAPKNLPVAPAGKPQATPKKKEAPSTKISKPPSPKAPPRIHEERESLSQIWESLDALKTDSTPKKKSVSIPAQINMKPKPIFEEEPASFDFEKREMLAAYLQNSLQLPEFGEVRVEIEIGRDGKLKRLEILEAKSRKNAEFLKKELPMLTYPCFNNSEANLNFTLVFRNVENS